MVSCNVFVHFYCRISNILKSQAVGQQDPDLQIIFEALIRIYLILVILTALSLSLFITGAPKAIKVDLTMTRIAVAVGILTVTISTSAEVVGMRDHLAYELVWWFAVMDVVFGTTVVMALLIFYQVGCFNYYSM